MALKKNSISNRAALRVILALLLLLSLLVLVFYAIRMGHRRLFSANRHFTLRRVVVKSGGWWKSREGEVCLILGLARGESNLFGIDLSAARLKIEGEPAIASASVYKIIPDTLVVEITERVPKAYVFFYGNKLVVDEDSVVMHTDSCVNFSRDLPVITGFKVGGSGLLPGNVLPQTVPALDFLDAAGAEAPRVIVRRVSLSNEKEFNVNISDTIGGRNYDLLLPRKGMREKLAVLEKVLEEIELIEGDVKTIDMRYKDQAVLR
ncbi:MAG: FtsQ-type POTRA domain-containing protein [Victivallales bacterium]|nr:FtsQ-type POTRA domain-containing protein [Victivallales bacterium]